jgi:hypothetical protein
MQKIFTLTFLFVVALFYQNCSEMTFTKSGTLSDKPVDNQLVVPDPGDDNDDNTSSDDPGDDNDDPGSGPTPSPTPSTPGNPGNPGGPGGDDPTGDDPTGDAPTGGSTGACREVDITSVLVNVNHVELMPAGVSVPVPADTVLDLTTLETTGFRFGPISGGSAVTHQVRLVLNDFGNKIISSGSTEVPLKTPSAQNSGLKMLLPGELLLEDGKTYIIKGVFDPSSKIVRAGKKCILKPVIKITQVEEAL